MVRLHVRKSLLSAWTSSRLSGRRRAAAHHCNGGRSFHRRSAAIAAAGVDEEHDIRLGVLLFSCCCSSDGTSCCCCCCMTDEECEDVVVVDANTVSRRRSSCLRWSVVRRCSTKVAVVAFLFVFFTVTTLYTSPSTYRDPGDADTSSSLSSVVLLSPARGHHGSVTSGMSAIMTPALLAMPDCDAIIAGDRAEIASTQRMLFQETRTTSSTFDASHNLATNCSPSFHRPVDNASPLAYIISNASRSVEQTELLLRAVYAAANIYCLTFDLCSSSDHAATTLRRLTSCFNNVIVVERTLCLQPSRDQKWSAMTSAWWSCVDRLLRHDVRWTHVVSLTVRDFPLRPRDDIARRLVTETFDVGRRTGSDVIKCGAYTRSAVSGQTSRTGVENRSTTMTSRSHSSDGATAIEVCARKCRLANDGDGDGTTNIGCYYTVADLPSLVGPRHRKLFANAFNLNVDHFAVRCLMQRIVK